MRLTINTTPENLRHALSIIHLIILIVTEPLCQCSRH